MDGTTEQARVKESPYYTVARLLQEKGYTLADCTGKRECEIPDRWGVGILKTKSPVKVKRLFRLVTSMEEPRASFVGMVWMDVKERGVKADRNWSLEIYGAQHANHLTSIVEQAAKHQNVQLKVELCDNNPRSEVYLSDF